MALSLVGNPPPLRKAGRGTDVMPVLVPETGSPLDAPAQCTPIGLIVRLETPTTKISERRIS